MRQAVLLDAGPLVTFLTSGLEHEKWVMARWKMARSPMLTCELVLTETAFLLKREGFEADPLFVLLERKLIQIGLHVDAERASLRALMQRYRNRPMSLADACLVRMSELYEDSSVFTLDADFRIYRRHGNKVISVWMPDK